MKTMCPPGYHHNGFVVTHAHDIYIYVYIYQICSDSEFHVNNFQTALHFFTIPLQECDM